MSSDPEKNVLPKDGITPVESGSHKHDVADDGVVTKSTHHPINEDKLRRALSPRQVQMIAIGGTIG